MIELITTTLAGDRYKLDTNDGEMVSVNKSFLELQDFTKRKSDFTKSFRLPRTTRNDKYFGLFGNLAATGIFWNTSFAAECFLLDETNLIIRGTLQLMETNTDNDYYLVSISGTLFSLKTAIGNKNMSDIDMTDWLFDNTDIINTWDRFIFGGHIVFPIHDFGFGMGFYKKKDTGNVIIDITNAYCTNSIILDRLLPAFRLNEILRRMFSGLGFKLSGSWFSEAQSENIYVQSDNPLSGFAELEINPLNAESQFTEVLNTYTIIPLIADPSNSLFNDTTHVFTASIDATYSFTFNAYASGRIPFGQYEWRIVKNGVTVLRTSAAINTGVSEIYSADYTLVSGDTIEMQIKDYTGGTPTRRMTIVSSTYMQMTSFTLAGTDTNPAQYLKNYKQIDFLREIVGIFNIVLWRDNELSFRLDTYDYYMANYGEQKDWTNKIDVSKKVIVKPVNTELTNPINLELKHGQDVLNTEYIEVTGRAYGAYREDTRLPYTKEQQKPFKIFAPSPLQEIYSEVSGAEHTEIVCGKYFASADDLTYKPPGLQLMYYCGVRALTIPVYAKRFIGDICLDYAEIPVFSPFYLYSVDSWKVQADTLDLNFTWFTPPSDNVDEPAENNLYERYFKEMLRDRYSPEVKVVEFYAFLSTQDITQFSFADKIMININGTPVSVRVLEIKDYVPNSGEPAKIKAMITFI